MAKKAKQVEPDRVLIPGRPDLERCDNEVVSAKYTVWNFFPKVSESYVWIMRPTHTSRSSMKVTIETYRMGKAPYLLDRP